ncbi:MAG: plasmid mobilization relaxosome protein MobC [Acetobacteraceae bacterium]|nr:plasmid mobilization relaxosome protein MobC [Acetobacteraceae bacterium]
MTERQPRPESFRRRSGSRKRARSRTWQIVLTDEEYAAGLAKAAAAGLSQSSYGRAALLGAAGPRARRARPVNAQVLQPAIVALNRIGSNLNQITHLLHVTRAAEAGEAQATLDEVRALLVTMRSAIGGEPGP